MTPECPHYVADIGTRRCRSYIDGGTCSRPDQFVCTEWQRANARAPAAAPPSAPRLAQVVQLRPKGAAPAARNEHWSFSRLTRFESCPLSYKLHYLDKLPSEPGEPLQFGKAIHAVLEKLYGEHTLDEKVGGLDVQRALALFQIEWASAGLVGTALFREGIEMLERYCTTQGVVDHRSVLAIEKEFRLPIGRGEVLGYIDRIDRVDDTTIEVVDYKTNRQLFAREEVDESLQLGLYELAVRRLYPWVRNVRLSYVMLRHGSVKQITTRTSNELEAVTRYAATIGEAMDTTAEFPARVGPNCVYCDHRRGCGAYREVLEKEPLRVATSHDDLEALSRERERVAAHAKILYARRDELDRVLKAHLKNTDELLLAGTRYAMLKVTSTRHELDPVLRVLEAATGKSTVDVARDVCVVDKDKLDELLKTARTELGPSRAALLRAELEAAAEHTVTTRLWAKTIKKHSPSSGPESAA